MFPVKTILHPTDFSPSSDYAFRVASSMAKDHKARLVVMHVVPVTPATGVGMMPAAPPPELDRKATEAQLRQIRPEDSSVPVDHKMTFGMAAPEIIAAEKADSYDLIVMGSHGRTGLGRLLLGSVAENVLRHATCPVLVVKSPQSEDAEGALKNGSE